MITASKTRIGFVGVGRMGANMARRLNDAAFTVVAVYDTERTKMEHLANELGCAAVDAPAGVAEVADTVFTVITDDSAMRQIYATDRADSLLKHAKGRL